MPSGNSQILVLKKIIEDFPKVPPLKEISEYSRLKNNFEMSTKKENFKPEIKSMIENVQGELYQLVSKQTKGAKLQANVR